MLRAQITTPKLMRVGESRYAMPPELKILIKKKILDMLELFTKVSNNVENNGETESEKEANEQGKHHISISI